MKRIFSASACSMLLLVAILNGLTISFAAEARFGNPLASPASAEGKAPPVTGAAPDAVVPVQKSLPRYYFHAYVTVDEKGDARSFTDQVQIDDYLQKLQKWIPDRILKSDPGNCEQANPCEEDSTEAGRELGEHHPAQPAQDPDGQEGHLAGNAFLLVQRRQLFTDEP